MFNSIKLTSNFILAHPLGSKHKVRAFLNWFFWQFRCRIGHGFHKVKFVGSTRLFVRRGMHGATGNIYCGLHEFEDMAFVLHFLQPDDLFVDIGANIGSYTVLASGVCGSNSISIEPDLSSAASLKANVDLNHLGEKVCVEQCALGDQVEMKSFSSQLDCINHIVTPDEALDSTSVEVNTLDEVLKKRRPTILKIDVEGYELFVLRGGGKTLACADLQAIIIELNGSGQRYGISDLQIAEKLQSFGFSVCSYCPLRRILKPASMNSHMGHNTLFIRNIEEANKRVMQSPKYKVLGEVF